MGEFADWIESLPRQQPPLSLSAGETLFRRGQHATAIYLVRAGRMRLIRPLEDGSSVTIHVAEADSVFAEAALFADHYHCDAVAETDAEVEVIAKNAILATIASDPTLSLRLARNLAAQVRDLRARLELRNIRSARERVLSWLRLQAGRVPGELQLDRPWTAIAAELGLTHEAVYRALAALEREGAIERRKGHVRLGKH